MLQITHVLGISRPRSLLHTGLNALQELQQAGLKPLTYPSDTMNADHVDAEEASMLRQLTCDSSATLMRLVLLPSQ